MDVRRNCIPSAVRPGMVVVSQTIGLVLLAAMVFAADSIPAAVRTHLEANGNNPDLYYLVGDLATARVGGFVLSSCSTTPEIERCLPTQIQAGLWWIDLSQLGWSRTDWRLVLSQPDGTPVHPYGGWSRIVRLDWLLIELLDTQLSASRHKDGIASYYRLLYGAKSVPKTEKELLTYWEVDSDDTRAYGQIEGVSQVNKQGRRWIEYRARQGGGYAWITRDSLLLNTVSDPLERPAGDFKHDGTEVILGIPKFSSVTFDRFNVQVYALANGAGAIVDEAPVQLVEDYKRFRGITSIRTAGSCIACHVDGINPLDSNALVELQQLDTAVFSKDPEALRRFHYGSLDPLIQRNQQDYTMAVAAHTGFTDGAQMVGVMGDIIYEYQRPLNLRRAGQELGVAGSRLRDAIRTIGEKTPVPAGLASLAGGGVCSRDLFEEQYGTLNEMLKATK